MVVYACVYNANVRIEPERISCTNGGNQINGKRLTCVDSHWTGTWC